MKSLKESLFDDDLVSKDIYLYHPKTKNELMDCIREELERQGLDANLNIIDVSEICDMSCLFHLFQNIRNIDISDWDVSNVNTMHSMFYECKNFNSDLSKWNVGNVRDMSEMFCGCKNFNSDLSKWDVKKVKHGCMGWMFCGCKKFDSDLSKWYRHGKIRTDYCIFGGCTSLKKIPSWYYGES